MAIAGQNRVTRERGMKVGECSGTPSPKTFVASASSQTIPAISKNLLHRAPQRADESPEGSTSTDAFLLHTLYVLRRYATKFAKHALGMLAERRRRPSAS